MVSLKVNLKKKERYSRYTYFINSFEKSQPFKLKVISNNVKDRELKLFL